MAKKTSKLPLLGFLLTGGLIAMTAGIFFFLPEKIHQQQISLSKLIESAPDKNAPQKTFNAQSYTLDNGLRLILIPNHRAPVVTHMVWYKVGAADEKAGKSGIAHFLEHLMFKGTTTSAPGDFSRTIRTMGGNENAFTSQDYTAYYENVAAQYLPKVMAMEADRMRSLAPPLNEVDSERNVIIEERNQRTDNSPAAKFREHFRAMSAINHPYGTPVIGWRSEMETLSWEDAKSFYDKHYGPNNAIVVIVGDIDPEQTYELAQSIYGPLTPITLEPRIWTKRPPLSGTPTLNMSSDQIRQPQINLLFKVPSAAQDKETSLALELIQMVMGENSSSRLYKELVINQKIATSISMSYSSTALSHSELWINAYPAPDTDINALKEAILSELNKLVQNGINDEERNTAIRQAQDAAIFARDSLTGPAMIIGQSLVSNISLNDVEYWSNNIAKITKEQMQKTAQEYLNPEKSDKTSMSVGILTPAIKNAETQQE